MDSKFFWTIMAIGFAVVVFIVILTGEWNLGEQTARVLKQQPAAQPAQSIADVQRMDADRKLADERRQAELKQAEENRLAELKRQQDEKALLEAKQAEELQTKRGAEIERIAQQRSTADLVNDFFADYLEMLDELDAQPSTEEQVQAVYDLSGRLDSELKNQTWELHCQVQKVELLPAGTSGSQRLYSISHVMPDEITSIPIPFGWDIITKVSGLPLLSLAKQQVFQGDYIVYTGTPHFVTKAEEDDTADGSAETSSGDLPQPVTGRLSTVKCLSSTIEIAGKKYEQTLFLGDLRFQFLKPDAMVKTQAVGKVPSLAISDPAILANIATSQLPNSATEQVDVIVINNPYPQYSTLWWVWRHERGFHDHHYEGERQATTTEQTTSSPQVTSTQQTKPTQNVASTQLARATPQATSTQQAKTRRPVAPPVRVLPPVHPVQTKPQTQIKKTNLQPKLPIPIPTPVRP